MVLPTGTVGGLLSIDKCFKFIEDNPSETDFNNLKENGVYFILNRNTYNNVPPTFSSGTGTIQKPYFTLVVFSNGNAAFQMCVNYNSRISVRTYNGVGKYWTKWVDLEVSL